METTSNINILEGQVAEFSFQDNKIINTINMKEYVPNGSITYVEGHNGTGLQINGGQVSIPLSDLEIDANTQTVSVSFWFKWNGTIDCMPIGFERYDAWIHDGFFGFNTNQSDVYGINNPYVKGQFIHTILIFNKGDYTLNSIYINGVKQTLSQKEEKTQLQSLAIFDKSINISGYLFNDSWRYNGDVIDDLKIFNRALTENEVALLSSEVVLDIEPAKSKIYLNETISADLVIKNVNEIAAEDLKIKYDNSKLQFIDITEVEGIKLVKKDVQTDGFRLMLASKGVENITHSKKVLLKLNFKGIATGDALIDITKGKISDGINIEENLLDSQCSGTIITIKELKDVNKNGEFTLLDLAIDARHYGEDPTSLPQYDADQVINGLIDDDDLLKISEYILSNSNYKLD